MKIKLISFFFTLNLIFIVLSGCLNSNELGPEVREYFEEEYMADNNTTMIISNVNGEIKINSWGGKNLSLNATKRSNNGLDDLEKAQIIVTQNNNQFKIEIEHEEPIRNRAVDLDIKIPYNVTVEKVTSTNGPIEIKNVKGNIDITNINGPITVEGVDGYVKAVTTNGGIEIKNTTGIDYVTSTNGGVYVEILDFNDDLVIQTTNGGITAYMSQTLNASIEIMTVNGGITIEDLEISVIESTSKYLKGIIGDNYNTITIITTNGGITVNRLEI